MQAGRCKVCQRCSVCRKRQGSPQSFANQRGNSTSFVGRMTQNGYGGWPYGQPSGSVSDRNKR